MSERASIFGDNTDFDVSGFTPKKSKTEKIEAPAEAIRAVSEASSFKSREAIKIEVKEDPKREPRRYRTGRNVQLNLKVRAETLESFYEIADRQGWVLGETLEKALAALKREIAAKNERFGEG